MIPNFVTHYYHVRPFRSLTELMADDCAKVLSQIKATKNLPRRLESRFYFEERRRYEGLMVEQFLAKGGKPERSHPHYAVLGESEIWAKIYPHAIQIPLTELPTELLSFTYTDSFANYVDRDLDGNPIPRKPQYGMLYRLEELDELFKQYGWPGDRWKSEEEWAHDIYVEAQIWSDEPLQSFLLSEDSP